MPNSIFNQLIGNDALSVVNKITNTVVMPGVKIISVDIKFLSELLKNQKENGEFKIDSRILTPTQVTINAICESIDSVDGVNQIINSKETLYQLYSRGLYVDNLMLDRDAMSQTPVVLSANPIVISFREIILQNDSSIQVAQSGDSDSVIGGIRKAVDVVKEKATEVTDNIISFFKS